MNRKYLACIFLAFIFANKSFPSNAQSFDSLYNEILMQPETKETFVIKSRNYLYEQLELNNRNKIREVLNFYKMVAKDTIALLGFNEEMLFYYWLEDFDSVLELYKKTPDYPYFSYQQNLNFRFSPFFYQNRQILYNNIELSNKSIKDKVFLTLLLKNIIGDYTFSNFRLHGNDLSIKAEEFIHKYPESEYCIYLKKYILPKVKRSNFGIDCKGIGGISSFSGYAKNYLTKSMHLGGGLEMNYKRINSSFNIQIGGGKIKKPFDYDNKTISLNNNTNLNILDASIGYAVLNNRFKLSPFLGLSRHYFFIHYNNNSEETYELKLPTYKLYGIDLKWNFYISDVSDFKNDLIIGDYYLFFRFDYRTPFSQKIVNDQFKQSNIWFSNFGIGMSSIPIKRVK